MSDESNQHPDSESSVHGRTWIPLGNEAQGLVEHGRVVAVAYAEETEPGIWELWWLPTAAPDQREVLFGVGEDVGTSWENRWSRARASSERLYDEAHQIADPLPTERVLSQTFLTQLDDATATQAQFRYALDASATVFLSRQWWQSLGSPESLEVQVTPADE